MIAGLLLAALALALFAPGRPGVAACALAGSAALTSLLRIAGVPYDFTTWVLIDVAVICIIERGPVRGREHAVCGLFPVAWALCHAQPPGWIAAVNLIVTAQFLLTVPWDRLKQFTWAETAA